MEEKVVFKEESFHIIGACFEVYNEKGNGFLEAVYQECLDIELGGRGIPFAEKPRLKLQYKGHELKQQYKIREEIGGRTSCSNHQLSQSNRQEAWLAGELRSLS